MSSLDIEARLLSGKPILIENIGYLYPYTYDEIIEIGINTYYYYVSILCWNLEYIKKIKELDTTDGIIKIDTSSIYDFIINQSIYNKNYLNLFELIFSLFFKEDVIFDYEKRLFCLKEKTINDTVIPKRYIAEEGFKQIQSIIMKQNGIKEEIQAKPLNNTAKKMLEQIEKMREKYGANKKKDANTNTLPVIVSALSSKHPSINLLNVGQLTIYQIHDQYQRVNLIDNYTIGIESLLAGASKDDVELKHWSSRIDK